MVASPLADQCRIDIEAAICDADWEGVGNLPSRHECLEEIVERGWLNCWLLANLLVRSHGTLQGVCFLVPVSDQYSTDPADSPRTIRIFDIDVPTNLETARVLGVSDSTPTEAELVVS
ncbi:hypothetical protein [Streptosporangium saharense]|uniref:Uncharacterized protein n=1 Tax=Streptosporangium saharense TaxID=1706840 RepID=A0A7W7VNZ9_9ACTN|nr:hypothetical protein [Streptosporangium saharense]MBB4917446.1 hypothetical protein [Streptosporangium saharense]